ncbi:14.7 kDa ribonuclease H-like protein [Listeria grayi]|uniref:Ribonuclease HI n=1 Tax=Listeria grayi FSL F6-1183 TaxID=1265827 RepID=A0A829R415_LISGR|nr:ribonuclease HI family protein [Listeria grayi]EUJ27078.1 ribonuclease HI [Listeria grayi FSL F6-1183]VEI32972.1 14.7 kDa ribonuclease H-like protein [Listeria grayi]
MEIFVDAASAGNPGLSGAGIVLSQGELHEQLAIPLGTMTNHEAEFIAIKLGLRRAVELGETAFVRVYSDSKVAIEAIEKRFVKNPLFKPYLEEILQLISHFSLFFIEWRSVTKNRKADELARRAIQSQRK